MLLLLPILGIKGYNRLPCGDACVIGGDVVMAIDREAVPA